MSDIISHARVSTDGQSVSDQIVQLKAAGATKLLSEKLSGALAKMGGPASLRLAFKNRRPPF